MLKLGDKVICVLNKSIKGEVRSKNNFYGLWMFHIKPDNEELFRKRTGFNSCNTPFLNWQLKRREI